MRARGARSVVVVVAAAVVAATLAGCATTPTPAWTSVALPGDATPVTLTSYGDHVLVGAQDPRGSGGHGLPRLFLVGDGAPAPIPVEPVSPYARQATWLAIRREGDRLTAVAGARGGAHSNMRWTVWSGTVQGLTELPQGFSTFGGWGAGDLIGVAAPTTGPLVVGTWQSAQSGQDAAVWRRTGDAWDRQSSAGTALESTRSDLVGPRATDALGAGAVIVGSTLHLGDGWIDQRAALWASETGSDRWRQLELPSPGQGEAVAVTCTPAECVVVGRTAGRLAVWTFDGTAATSAPVPDVTVDEKATLPAPAVVGSRVILAVDAGEGTRLLDNEGGGWRKTDGPAGHARALAIGRGRVYVVAVDGDDRAVLWSRTDSGT